MKYTQLSQSHADEIVATYRRAVNSCLSAGLTADEADRRAVVAVDLDADFQLGIQKALMSSTLFRFLNDLTDHVIATASSVMASTNSFLSEGDRIGLRILNRGDRSTFLYSFSGFPPEETAETFKRFVDTRFGPRASAYTANFDPFSGEGCFAYFDIEEVIGKEFEGDFEDLLAA